MTREDVVACAMTLCELKDLKVHTAWCHLGALSERSIEKLRGLFPEARVVEEEFEDGERYVHFSHVDVATGFLIEAQARITAVPAWAKEEG